MFVRGLQQNFEQFCAHFAMEMVGSGSAAVWWPGSPVEVPLTGARVDFQDRQRSLASDGQDL